MMPWAAIFNESDFWGGGGREWPTRIFCRCIIKLESRGRARLRYSVTSVGVIVFLRPSVLFGTQPYG